MKIFPAIDLYEGKAVRLLRGDYDQMTVYSDDPVRVAQTFAELGARYIHIVDLKGARYGGTPDFETVSAIKERSGLFCEIGGGVRDIETVKRYLGAGLDRLILGTAAVKDLPFLMEAVGRYGERIAVGVDLKDGKPSVSGWTEEADLDAFSFCEKLQKIGVRTLICTDISRDGVMRGANRALYKELSDRFSMQIVASGGVSTLDDVSALAQMGLYGAIIGKAYYTGAISLEEAIEVAK